MWRCFAASGAVAITFRLGWLAGVRHSEFVERATKQQQRTFDVSPQRGVCMTAICVSWRWTISVDSVYAVPSELGENKDDDAALLANIVHTDPLDHFTTEQEIKARFNASRPGHASRNFAWVAKKSIRIRRTGCAS